MNKSKKLWIWLKLLLIIVVLIAIGFINPLKLTKYDIYSSTLPEEFDGYRIVQITDFHCKEFGDKEANLIELVKKADPDLIVLTGDIVDEVHTVENADYLLVGLVRLAPVYYVTGNHEYYDGAPYDEFQELCAEYGITILDNESRDITKNGATIKISGLDWHSPEGHLRNDLGYADANYYNILLFHNAAKFDFLAEFGYDLIFTGHIHGGLVRIPIVGGVFSSEYTLFPKYDYGEFKDKASTMVCSSGLGDARIPRWNNPREVVLVTLHVDD